MDGFFLGVNYWASHAGTDMWRNWDETTVENDLHLLTEYGIQVLRVFPNWRDFQPVEPMLGSGHRRREYRMAGDRVPENPWFLDEEMLTRFHRFCRLAEKHGLKLIVGLITGWMSGRLFVPPALYDKNIYTDPEALFLQQKFVRGFVNATKDQSAILAWDLGNECNCMDQAPSREAAYAWSAVIANAIRACDPDRKIVSGMHSLEPEGIWTLQDQGELTDVLTTHPYPLWVPHCSLTPISSFRTLLHATAQTEYYAAVGGKPCLVEEIGSMGPRICSEEIAAGFLRANLWSNWAHGAPGLMWWCAFDQTGLGAPPYDWNMCERELGMVTAGGEPKPTLQQMMSFREELEKLNFKLPQKLTDGVCILTKGQDHWGVAYMSYLLAKQAGLTLSFSYCDQPLPESKLYFLPSVHMDVMDKHNYVALREKICEGASLVISYQDGFLTEFEELTGLQVETSQASKDQGLAVFEDSTLPWRRSYRLRLKATRAQVLLKDEAGLPLLSKAAYGKGTVWFINFPLEEMLLDDPDAFDQDYYKLYAAADAVTDAITAAVMAGKQEKPIGRTNPVVGLTLHPDGERCYAVLVNYSDQPQDPGVKVAPNKSLRVLYGAIEEIPPFDAVVLAIENVE